MKALIVLPLLVLCGCGGSGGGGGGSVTSSDTAAPAIAQPGASPSAPQVCASLSGTDWVFSSETLTANSNPQSGHGPYVAEFDLSGANPQFIENQYQVGADEMIQCTRVYNDGIEQSTGPLTLSWTDTTGFCGAVVGVMAFDTTTCNQLTVSFYDGLNQLYETVVYLPR